MFGFLFSIVTKLIKTILSYTTFHVEDTVITNIASFVCVLFGLSLFAFI